MWNQTLLAIMQKQLSGLTIVRILCLLLLSLIPTFLLKRKRPGTSIVCITNIYLSSFYIGIIFLITIVQRQFGSQSGMILLQISLLDIKDPQLILYILLCFLLNIVLFVPLGFFIRFSLDDWEQKIYLVNTTTICLVITACVECIQLFTGTGIFDIYDILANTCGGSIGSGIAYMLHWFLKAEDA